MDRAHVRDAAIALRPSIVRKDELGEYVRLMTGDLLSNDSKKWTMVVFIYFPEQAARDTSKGEKP